MLETIGFTMIFVGVSLIIISLVLTVVWKVPSLIDELSGRKAKRQIERMKKLNIASSSLSDMNTAEFYKSMRNDEPILMGVDDLFNDRLSSGSELNKLVNNPNKVGIKKSEVVKGNYSRNGNVSEEAATDMFDVEVEQPIKKAYRIQIVEEQSSI